MEHRNLKSFTIQAFVPGDESDNAWVSICKTDAGEEVLLSFSLAVAKQMFGQLHAALRQASQEGKPVEIPSTPERITRYNAIPFQADDGERLVDILLEGDQSPRAMHGVMQNTQARAFAALLQHAAESSGPMRAN